VDVTDDVADMARQNVDVPIVIAGPLAEALGIRTDPRA